MVRVYRSDLVGYYDVEDTGMSLDELRGVGYTTNYQSLGKDEEGIGGASEGGGTASSASTAASREKATATAQALYSYLPSSVIDEFINNFINTGDADISIGLTRKSQTWLDNFSYLLNDDGTLAMDEITALSTINTYKQTLKEVGIDDFTDFEDEFKEMVTSVSGAEFQERIDTVYAGVVDQIPEVMEIYSNMLGITADAPTVFAALINPKIEDKFLRGQIATVQIGAQSKKAGFGFSYDRFDALRRQGLTAQKAQQLYSTAGGMMSQAQSIGRDLSIETLEQATLGDITATNRLARISAELQSEQGLTLGAAKKGDEITGLIAD